MYTVSEQTNPGSLQGRSFKIKVFFVVASRCSQNHFISEKYKTGQSFKLHLLLNNPLVQLYTFASDCECYWSWSFRGERSKWNFLGQTVASRCVVFSTFRELIPYPSSGCAGGLVTPKLVIQ